jgi:hypothetical protein
MVWKSLDRPPKCAKHDLEISCGACLKLKPILREQEDVVELGIRIHVRAECDQ